MEADPPIDPPADPPIDPPADPLIDPPADLATAYPLIVAFLASTLTARPDLSGFLAYLLSLYSLRHTEDVVDEFVHFALEGDEVINDNLGIDSANPQIAFASFASAQGFSVRFVTREWGDVTSVSFACDC